MAIICRSIGLLFIMTPRTGCSAVGRLLREKLGGEWLPEEHILDADGAILVGRKHCTLAQLMHHGLLSQTEAGQLLKVTAVRNPFDSLVSLYTKRHCFPDEKLSDPANWIQVSPRARREVRYARTRTFDQWVRHHYLARAIVASLHLRRPSLFERFTDGVDVVLRFEHLQEDLDSVLRRCGVSGDTTLPTFNVTHGRGSDYRTYYGVISRAIVALAFRHDLKRHAYGF